MFNIGRRKSSLSAASSSNGGKDGGTASTSSSSALLASAFDNLAISDGEYAQKLTSNLPSGITPETASEMVAQTMNSLSVEERNKTFEAIHGCRTSPFAKVSAPIHSMATATSNNNGGGKDNDGSQVVDDVEEDDVIDDDDDLEHDVASDGAANTKRKTSFVNQRLQQMKNELLERCNKVLLSCPSYDPQKTQQEEEKEQKQSDGDNDDNTNNNLPGYVLAIQQNSNYVMSLRLMFLRCEDYNVKAAIARLIAFFNYKLEIFPITKLSKDITLQDLKEIDPNDIKYLNAGFHQMLPGTDNCGRTIIFFHRGNTQEELELFDSIPVNSILRVVLYMVMTHIQVPYHQHSVQKSGYVVVGYDFSNQHRQTTFSYESQLFAWKVCKLINVLPYQLNCLHYCYNDNAIDLLVAIARTALGARSRTRFRPHTGKSYVEIMYELMTYGITQDQLPIITSHSCRGGSSVTTASGHQDEGFVTMDKHMLFLERIRNLEKRQQHDQQEIVKVDPPMSSSTNSSSRSLSESTSSGAVGMSTTVAATTTMIVPTKYDVLLGKGGNKRHQHYGNQRLHQLLSQYQEQYESCSRFEKTVIAGMIVNTIQASNKQSGSSGDNGSNGGGGGRFLRQDSKTGDWFVVSDAVARERVSHGFRNRRARSGGGATKNQQQQQQQQSHVMSNSADNPAMMMTMTGMSDDANCGISLCGNNSNSSIGNCGGSSLFMYCGNNKRHKPNHFDEWQQ